MRARWATLLQIPECISYAIANRVKGSLDPMIFNYPTLRVMRAENDQGCASVYVPVHSGAILETLGWAPDLSAENKVLAAVTATQAIEQEVWLLGYREVFFVSSDQQVDEFCEKHLGFERVVVMRKRLAL